MESPKSLLTQPTLDSSNSIDDESILLSTISKLTSITEMMRQLGIDPAIVAEAMMQENQLAEDSYEQKRSRMIDECATEGTDMHLHNDCVTELLMFMDGGHPAFGNVVGEMYQMCEAEGTSPMQAALTMMRRAPMYRRPAVA